MAYTTVNKSSDYFNTKLYTGNGSTNAITGVGFQPDLLWFKNRTSAINHMWFDSVRGINKYFYGNLSEAEGTSSSVLTAVGSDGFTVGANNNVNGSSNGIASWNWKAGTSFTNDASSTGIGSIDSVGSASNVSGFSIVSFTGTGSNGTIKHGLSTALSMVIIKRRDSSNDWRVGSDGLTNWTKHINLNTTAAESDLASAFNSTAPTSSVFSVGTSPSTNASGGTYIAYCFSSIKGYSKVGSYTGNGNADGPFVYTGFKPAFVLQKNASATQGWQLQDNKREGYNGDNDLLQPHDSAAESGVNRIDILSNGFKVITTDAGQNSSGATYIYMAFAENPFVTSGGVPGLAE